MKTKLLFLLNKVKLKNALLAFFFFAFTSAAMASHYRHGTISWRVVSGNTIEFKISQAWANYGNWSIGQTGYGDTFYFGDGQSKSFSVVITAVNTAENWYYGETTFTHTYANIGNFNAYFSSCCKIGQLSNNANAYWRNETIVNVGSGNESPVTTMAPIINMQGGTTAATFQVPASDPDGDNLTYRLATYNEIRGGQPSGVSINSSTGVLTFNTQGRNINSLWNVAIVVSDGKTKVINDFIIKIVQQSNPPAFDYTVTPLNGAVYQVSPGVPVNFSVKADDTDPGATVSLQSIGVPVGASVTLSNQNTSSITGTFNWTPTANNLGTNVINFLAQDNVGAQVSTSVTIFVSLKPQFDSPPTPAQGVHNVYNPGDVITYTVQASDPDPLDVVRITDIKGKNMMAQPIPLYANASFSNLNGTAANPTSGTFTWNTQASDWGHKHVYLYATDSYGDVTKHEVSQLINTPPVFTSNPVLTADVGTPYSATITVTDADIPYGDAITFIGNTIPSWLTLTDNGDGTATLSGTPTTADVGNGSVNIQAEDINHHQDPRGIINQLFDITVNNCVVTAITKDITVNLDAAGNATITADDINNESIATCGVASMVLDVTSFTCANIGKNTVTLTVTDGSNYSSSAIATVTIVDNIAPTVITQPLSVSLDANGNASITAAQINNNSTDNCAIESMSLDITSFTCANVGANTVTLTVTDVNGNKATNTAVVTVSDNIAPTVITKPFSIPLANGVANITADDINDGSFDNCDFTLSIDINRFTCADIGDHIVTLTATDASGNTSSKTAIVTIIGETPEITIANFNAVETQQANTIFLGFGPQSMALETTATGGDSFTYVWTASSGENVSNVANPVVSPTTSTTYTVTATNNYGCTTTERIEVCVMDVRSYDKKGRLTNKVDVCHHTNGKKGTKHVMINISKNAVMKHLTLHGAGTSHGDKLGNCEATCVTSSITPPPVAEDETSIIATSHLIYPNPSNGIFNIRLNNTKSDTEITLFNISGKLIATQRVSKNSKEISIGSKTLPTGFYILKIISSEETVIKRVVVK